MEEEHQIPGSENSITIPVVILCGGKATRLYPLSQKVPKAMTEIEGKPFLEYQIDLLKRNGIFDIVLCIGDKGEQIKEHFQDGERFDVRIKYSQDGEELLGTAGALKKAENLLADSFLVLFGDTYLSLNFQEAINFFEKNRQLGMMTVFRNAGKYAPSNTVVENGLVKYYSKKRHLKNMNYIDCGLGIIRKDSLKYLRQGESGDLAILNQALIKRQELLAYPIKKRFYDIGTFRGLADFRRYILRHKNNVS